MWIFSIGNQTTWVTKKLKGDYRMLYVAAHPISFIIVISCIAISITEIYRTKLSIDKLRKGRM